MALEDGVATKTYNLNLRHRLIDGKADRIARVDAPERWLRGEPKANVGNYDPLREELRHAS